MLNVLIVDDDPIVRKGLKTILPWDKLGVRLIGEAANGAQALALIEAAPPDLVITDIKMPVMDGLQLCRHISRQYAGISVILLTGYDDFEYARTALSCHVVDYILKPIDFDKIDQLTEHIKNLLKRRDLRRMIYHDPRNDAMLEHLINRVKQGDLAGAETAIQDLFFEAPGIDSILNIAHRLLVRLYEALDQSGLGEILSISARECHYKQLLEEKQQRQIVLLVRSVYEKATQTIRAHKDMHVQNTVAQMLAYIADNFTDPDLSACVVADAVFISANYACNIFMKYRHMGINQYIESLRIDRARCLLRDPTMKVASIAEASGYRDARYFARVFKKAEGMTPSVYRNLNMLRHTATAP